MSLKLHTEIVERPLSELLAHPRNSRKHPAYQLEQIAASLHRYGFAIPVIADPDGLILAGHARVQAAKKAGFTHAPVITVKGWSEDQKRAYLIADNQLTLGGDWDTEILRSELAALQESLFDVAITGFAPAQVHRLTVPRPPKDTRGDKITNPLGNDGGEFLEWQGHMVPMSAAETKAMQSAFTKYVRATGGKTGFLRALMDGSV